jgi:hypothetical protein
LLSQEAAPERPAERMNRTDGETIGEFLDATGIVSFVALRGGTQAHQNDVGIL